MFIVSVSLCSSSDKPNMKFTVCLDSGEAAARCFEAVETIEKAQYDDKEVKTLRDRLHADIALFGLEQLIKIVEEDYYWLNALKLTKTVSGFSPRPDTVISFMEND